MATPGWTVLRASGGWLRSLLQMYEAGGTTLLRRFSHCFSLEISGPRRAASVAGLIYGMVDGPIAPGRQGVRSGLSDPPSRLGQFPGPGDQPAGFTQGLALSLRLEQFERAAVTGSVFGWGFGELSNDLETAACRG